MESLMESLSAWLSESLLAWLSVSQSELRSPWASKSGPHRPVLRSPG
jgi:hypothetical protein